MVQPSKAPTSGSWASTVRGPDLDASIFQIGSDPTTEQRATSQSTRIGLVNQRFFPFPQRRTVIRMTFRCAPGRQLIGGLMPFLENVFSTTRIPTEAGVSAGARFPRT